MLPQRARLRRHIALLVAWAVIAAFAPRVAHADQVDKLIRQLQSSSDYKVRLSAALNLAKIRDKRAIPVFVRALSDSDKTVRGVAAAGLGKLVNAGTSASVRKKVLAKLKFAATRDKNSFVRKQAQKAYDSLKGMGQAGGGGAIANGATYINIGGMSAETDNAAAIRRLMKSTVEKTFQKNASSWAIEWPGGDPKKSTIQAKRINAFHVDGTVNAINASGGWVECKVSMLLATYPEKSMFGFLKGGAKVQAGSSQRDIDLAAQDCVGAVMEDLIRRKIIPTIQSRI